MAGSSGIDRLIAVTESKAAQNDLSSHVQTSISIEAGVAVTRGGETAERPLEVEAATATSHSIILLTPLDNPEAILWIAKRDTRKFFIAASNPLPARLTIQYLIIN